MTSQPTPDPTVPPSGVSSTASPVPGGPSKSSAAGSTTLTGTVQSGVEPGCLLLDDYLLIGGPRDVLTTGARVEVTGQVQADLMTTCQQGTPFVVTAARRA